MAGVGTMYGQALYSLVKEEGISDAVYNELKVLMQSFQSEPNYISLLSAPSLSKVERCAILDEGFGDILQPYVLNFLKILTEKGYIRQFSKCVAAYEEEYNADHDILKVRATTKIAISKEQSEKLTKKLSKMTGKYIYLENRVDPECLGGVRLDFDGKCLDGTIVQRMKAIGDMFKNTVI